MDKANEVDENETPPGKSGSLESSMPDNPDKSCPNAGEAGRGNEVSAASSLRLVARRAKGLLSVSSQKALTQGKGEDIFPRTRRRIAFFFEKAGTTFDAGCQLAM